MVVNWLIAPANIGYAKSKMPIVSQKVIKNTIMAKVQIVIWIDILGGLTCALRDRCPHYKSL